MCIILIGQITREQFNQAKAQNQDGFSLFTEEKGLIKAPTQDIVDKVLEEKQFGIWHFRIGTSGTINKNDTTNIHPFEICNGKYLLYHNGIIGGGDGKRSDTHCLADTLKTASLETAETVVKALSDGNRFVIANAEDVTDYRIYGKWECEAGVLMSHKMYKYSYSGSSKYSGYSSYSGYSNYSKPSSKPATKDEDIDYKVTVAGEKTDIEETIKAEKNLTDKELMRKWLCKCISNLSVKGKDIYYHTKNSDELIGYTDREIKDLQKNHNKKFTEAFLKAFDKETMDLCYSANQVKTTPSTPSVGCYDDDDWFY